MKDSLAPGLTHRLEFTVPHAKTVPYLYPESDIYRAMPSVFATGYMVGLFEWACVELIRNHLEVGEGSLGIRINVTHEAATPPGFTIVTTARLAAIEWRRLTFEVEAHDGVDVIGRGQHERMVVEWSRFNERLALKTDGAGG